MEAAESAVPTKYTVYYHNTNNWSTVNIYSWTSGSQTTLSGGWPGSAMNKVDDTNWYRYTIYSDTTEGIMIIFNNGSGSQTANLSYSSDNIYWDGTTAKNATYELKGSMNDWNGGANYNLTESEDKNSWYIITDLEANAEFKIYNSNDIWMGENSNNVKVTEAGTYLIRFYVSTGKIEFHLHEDANKDHVCDNGCTIAAGTHADNDKDHVCDHGCSEPIGDHIDENRDHVCDHGCSDPIENHECTVIKYNDDKHWKECEYCHGQEGIAEHEYEAEVITDASCESDGLKKLTCECGHETTEVIPAGHTLGEEVERTESTCNQPGVLAHRECSVCHKYFDLDGNVLESVEIEINPNGHHDSEEDDDIKCDYCGTILCEDHNYVDGEVITAATCVSAGSRHTTCSVCGATGTATIEIDENAHEWNAPTYSWSEDKTTCTATRTCKHNESHKETATATVTSTVTTAAKCETAGTRTYTATFAKDWAKEQTETSVIAATGHTFDQKVATSTYLKTQETFSTSGVYYYSCACAAKGTETFNIGKITTIYFKPNSNWTQANARFAAYFMDANKNTVKWVSMTDNDKDGIYECAVPTTTTWKYVIFVRMNPSTSTNDWNNKWDQTNDLELPTTGGKNLYTVANGAWSYGSGDWTKK